jgi:hypothetical protein
MEVSFICPYVLHFKEDESDLAEYSSTPVNGTLVTH